MYVCDSLWFRLLLLQREHPSGDRFMIEESNVLQVTTHHMEIVWLREYWYMLCKLYMKYSVIFVKQMDAMLP